MNIHDVVALLQDIPTQGLKRGQVGTIVETWTDDVYEVEFADSKGIAYAMVALHASQMMVLYWQPTPESV